MNTGRPLPPDGLLVEEGPYAEGAWPAARPTPTQAEDDALFLRWDGLLRRLAAMSLRPDLTYRWQGGDPA